MPPPRSPDYARARAATRHLVPAPPASAVPANDRGLPVLDAALRATRLGKAFSEHRLTDAQRDRLGRAIANRARDAARLATADLVAGKVTLPQWQSTMRAGIVASHAAATRARLGTRTLAAADRTAMEARLAGQLGYLDRFAAGIRSGEVPLGPAIVARAGLYGNAAWATAEAVAGDRARRGGMDQERNILGSADHCPGCLSEDGRGWVGIGELVPIGDRDCLGNCRCSIEYRRADGTVVPPRPPTVTTVTTETFHPPAPPPPPSPPPVPVLTPAERLLAERKARVDARMAELIPQQEAAAAATRAAAAEYERFRGTPSFTPERSAARSAHLAAQSRLRAVEREYNRLASWEDLAKEVPGLVPAGPIAERIRDYAAAEGDALLARLRERLAPIAAARQEFVRVDAEVDALYDKQGKLQDQAYILAGKGKVAESRAKFREGEAVKARLREVRGRRDELRDLVNNAPAESRRAVAEVLAVDRPAEIRLAQLPAGTIIEGAAIGNQPPRPLHPLDDATRATADEASSWLARITHAGDSGPIERQIGMAADQRAYHLPDHVAVKPGESADVIAHELSHAIDRSVGLAGEDVLQRSLEFLDHRTAGEAAVRMMDVPGVRPGAYGPNERGRGDDFGKVFDARPAQKYYVGSDYGGSGTEVLSMGVQMLYNDPAKLINNDPEYANYLIGVLRGPLR